MEEILCFIKLTIADEPPLASDHTELGLLPIEQFTHLQIPLSDFRKLTSSRFTGPAPLEQRLCTTGVPETIGYGSRLVERRVMENYEDQGWHAW